MLSPLDNPVFTALVTGDRHLGGGNDRVRFFDADVSPFAGFRDGLEADFDELHGLLPVGRSILYACRGPLPAQHRWDLRHAISGLQFLYDANRVLAAPTVEPLPLDGRHVTDMMALAALTKPGPFAARTIEFGQYHGIFSEGMLVAMTGQRLHAGSYTEISAVCTHPDHLGKGYAASLLNHQLAIILASGKQPFLHVRADNARAIALYERLGFAVNGPMNFYFMKSL
ncbi:MAG: family N-acetyltransferase [Flaviaesturariibacter sp.]|nr:family N-acetyltransferase [Flaviaesturariibacter sp.]